MPDSRIYHAFTPTWIFGFNKGIVLGTVYIYIIVYNIYKQMCEYTFIYIFFYNKITNHDGEK